MRAPEFWHGRRGKAGIAAGLLSPLGGAWNAAGRLRRAFAHPYQAAAPVICVGNLVAGGSGKTPVVLSLAAMLRECNTSVHIVARGYGGRLSGPVRVDPAVHDAEAVGDEALLLASAAPCWVARDRPAGVRAAVAAGADAVLLDDGLQNPRIAKDLSLLVVDAEYGFGNARLIPAGPLREPVASGLSRSDAVLLLGPGALPGELAACGLPVFRAALAPVNGERFAGARVVAFAGIGRPAKFFATLHAVGATVVAAHPFPDHHRFSPREIAALRRQAEQAGARLVTTAKDRIRLPPEQRDGIDLLAVEIRWAHPQGVARLVAGVADWRCDGYGRSAAGD